MWLTPLVIVLAPFFALLLAYFLGIKIRKSILWGAVVFLVSIFVQQIFQQTAIVLLNVHEFLRETGTVPMEYIPIVSISLGFLAGLCQEGFKFMFSYNRDVDQAISLGLGFGIVEASYIAFSTLYGSLTPQTSVTINGFLLAVSSLERFLVTIFHGFTTGFMVLSVRKGRWIYGLTSMIIVHGIIDTLAAHYLLTKSFNTLVLSYVSLVVANVVLIIFVTKDMRAYKTQTL